MVKMTNTAVILCEKILRSMSNAPLMIGLIC